MNSIYQKSGIMKKNFDKRNASIILNRMINSLDKRNFKNRKDEMYESAGA